MRNSKKKCERKSAKMEIIQNAVFTIAEISARNLRAGCFKERDLLETCNEITVMKYLSNLHCPLANADDSKTAFEDTDSQQDGKRDIQPLKYLARCPKERHFSPRLVYFEEFQLRLSLSWRSRLGIISIRTQA
jgi:hypothetical protein